jgi:hypothetical protein
MASVFSANDRFANSFGEGGPLRSTSFSNDEFRVAAQSRFGAPLTCLKPFINQQLKSSASAADKIVEGETKGQNTDFSQSESFIALAPACF